MTHGDGSSQIFVHSFIRAAWRIYSARDESKSNIFDNMYNNDKLIEKILDASDESRKRGADLSNKQISSFMCIMLYNRYKDENISHDEIYRSLLLCQFVQ